MLTSIDEIHKACLTVLFHSYSILLFLETIFLLLIGFKNEGNCFRDVQIFAENAMHQL